VEFLEEVGGAVVSFERGGYGCEFADALCGGVVIVCCDGSCEAGVFSGGGTSAGEEGGGD